MNYSIHGQIKTCTVYLWAFSNKKSTLFLFTNLIFWALRHECSPSAFSPLVFNILCSFRTRIATRCKWLSVRDRSSVYPCLSMTGWFNRASIVSAAIGRCSQILGGNYKKIKPKWEHCLFFFFCSPGVGVHSLSLTFRPGRAFLCSIPWSPKPGVWFRNHK